MKLYVESPAQLVDINHLPLGKIEATDAGVRIGALVRNSDLAYHEAIRTRYPVLSEALLCRGHAADSQHGDGRRQPAAADALHLLPRHRLAVQQAPARLRLLGAGRLQPQPRGPRHQRPVHRHAPVGHVRGAGRAGRGGPHARAQGRAQDPVQRVPRRYGDDPGQRDGAATRRADHRGRAAGDAVLPRGRTT